MVRFPQRRKHLTEHHFVKKFCINFINYTEKQTATKKIISTSSNLLANLLDPYRLQNQFPLFPGINLFWALVELASEKYVNGTTML